MLAVWFTGLSAGFLEYASARPQPLGNLFPGPRSLLAGRDLLTAPRLNWLDLWPARTFSQPIALTNQAAARKLPATCILTVDKGRPPEQDDFYSFYRRAQALGWPVLIMEGDHNVQRSQPRELVKLIEQAP